MGLPSLLHHQLGLQALWLPPPVRQKIVGIFSTTQMMQMKLLKVIIVHIFIVSFYFTFPYNFVVTCLPLLHCANDVFLSNSDTYNSTSSEVNTKEAELYISMPQVDFNSLRDDEVLEWWKSHPSMFHYLSIRARQFLALPASSDGVERLFSRSGETHGDKRKRLKENTLQSLMVIHVAYDVS
jgi:hypothetical protein